MTTTSLEPGLRAPRVGAPSGALGARFRSGRAAIGALVLLLALPFAIAAQMLGPEYVEVAMHFALALGTLIVGVSVFDFGPPKWMTRIACAAACVLAAIFFAQGLAALTQSGALRNLAYSTEVGGWGEAISVSIVMAWFIAVARTQRRGLTMLIGTVSALAVIGMSAWGLLAAPLGGTPAELRLVFLLPIAWLLFVSTRRVGV
jgi:hypothetical protein